MIAYLIPFKSVGDLEIGTPISCYESLHDFQITTEKFQTFTSVHYSIEYPKLTVFVTEGLIDSIACYEECLLKGRNLIGLTLEEFISYTEGSYSEAPDTLDFTEDNIPQYTYEFESLGLQVWIRKNKVVTIIVSGMLS